MAWKTSSKTNEPKDREKAYEYAVFLLSLQLRSAGEISAKMRQRGYDDEVTEYVIDRLKDQRFLDDLRYAGVFLENLKSYRNIGYYGIKKKFMEKKLPAAVIQSVLEEGFTLADERKVAERLLKKEGYVIRKQDALDSEVHYRSYDDADGEAAQKKTRLISRLKSRGFRGEVIAKLLF